MVPVLATRRRPDCATGGSQTGRVMPCSHLGTLLPTRKRPSGGHRPWPAMVVRVRLWPAFTSSTTAALEGLTV